jgi:hypothetical protein
MVLQTRPAQCAAAPHGGSNNELARIDWRTPIRAVYKFGRDNNPRGIAANVDAESNKPASIPGGSTDDRAL